MKRLLLNPFTWLLCWLSPGSWAVDAIYTPWHSNLAIKGYDPVAYFLENRPVEGLAEFEYDWQGATWRFANAEHRQRFIDDPQAYAPQYGGYCAYAVANGSTAGIDPTQFSVVDGKLYLNYSRRIQSRWLEDRAGYIASADEQWPEIRER
jgi:YHS domain-containing protein